MFVAILKATNGSFQKGMQVGVISFSSLPIRMSHKDCVFNDMTIILTPMQICEACGLLVLICLSDLYMLL